MPTDNLLAQFRADQVDQSELELLLSTHFGHSAGISPQEIHYSRSGAQVALVLTYSRDGELTGIQAGPDMQAEDVAAIADKVNTSLLAPGDAQIGQLVLFAHLQTTGRFQYRDVFQLLPMPPDAPQAPFGIGQHPLLLQYNVIGSTDWQISMLRRTRIGREIELLCVALTNMIRGGIGTTARYHWSLITSSDPGDWRSEFCQEAYTWPGANGIAPAYTPAGEIADIARIPASKYYTQRGISLGQTLGLPDSFEQLLDTYFACSRDDRDRFLRASFWFQYAQRVGMISHSGAFTALVSAVEALLPPPAGVTTCPQCTRPLGIGPTKRFVDFVEDHAPGLVAAQRRKLYALRSALSHGGALLHSDRYGWSGGMTGTSVSEWADQFAMWQVVRLVLVNWLLRRRDR